MLSAGLSLGEMKMATAEQGTLGQVVLTLTKDEAETLLYVAGCGPAYGTGRGGHLSAVYRALVREGVADLFLINGYNLFEGGRLEIRFKDGV